MAHSVFMPQSLGLGFFFAFLKISSNFKAYAVSGLSGFTSNNE